MLKQGSFIKKKYYKVFAESLPGSFAVGISIMLDSVLSGNQLGEAALTAVSIVAPLQFIILFFSAFYGIGYALLYGRANGEFDTDKAYRIAGQTVITTVFVSISLAALMLTFKQAFLNAYDCTGELFVHASAYYDWMIVYALILPMQYVLAQFLFVDADTLLTSIGGIVDIVLNIVLSAALCNSYGTAGLGMGTCIAAASESLILMLHFARKTNSIHFKFSFRFGELVKAVKLSSAVSLSTLFISLTDIVMNKLILVSCGVTMVAAYSVVNLVYNLYETHSATALSCQGFTSSFLGEKNSAGIKNVMKTALKATVGVGLVYVALLLIFAPMIPKLYGMETPELVKTAIFTVRMMSFAAVPYGIAYLAECTFPSFGKLKLGIVMTFLNDLFCPLILSVPFVYMFGFTGVAVGMSFNAYLVVAFFSLFVIAKYGKKGFPLYLEDYGEETVSFDLYVTEETITQIRDHVKHELDIRGFKIENIELLIEELYKRIYEKNPGKRIMSECTLLFGKDRVRILVRDDGVIFNFVDENNLIESLNAHVLNSLLEQTKKKEYILTTSFNRNGFSFEK